MNVNKRGVSPLIASVLLIAFTVVMAIFIMNWGVKLFETIKGQTERGFSTECLSMVDIKISNVSASGFRLENNGNVEIVGVKVRISDGVVSEVIDIDESTEAFGIKDYTFVSNISAINLKIFPKIRGISGVVVCDNKAKEVKVIYDVE